MLSVSSLINVHLSANLKLQSHSISSGSCRSSTVHYLNLICDSSSKEKKYAHFISQASWAGARIIQGQWTPQATELYDLLILTFKHEDGKLGDLQDLKTKSGVSDEDWTHLLQYTSQVNQKMMTSREYL